MFVPEKFKAKIYERFDVRNAVRIGDIYVITIPCPLCIDFYHNECKGCPFDEYDHGCDEFMMEHDILPRVVNVTVSSLWWHAKDMAEAVEWFNKVRDVLNNRITWVKEV